MNVDVTFDLPDDLVCQVQRKAAASGTTIEAMILEILQRIADGEIPATPKQTSIPEA